ncbi:MAG: RagB/SusD family nutrient uptake outer membrane protein [candidate division KSB1 bacterium]
MTNKMRSKLLLFILSTIFVLASCETLEFSNPNAPIVDDVTVQSLVSGVEAGMRLDWAIYLRVTGINGREVYYFEPADPRYTGEILFGTPDPGGFLTTRPWTARYRVIANCRFLQDKNAGAGVDGFAKTIQAYQLLLNLNYMYDNGIKIDYSGDLTVAVANRAQAYDAIHDLLDEAETDLKNAGAAFPFRLTSGFTGFDTPTQFLKFNRAISARVSVYRGEYDHALEDLQASFLNPSGSLNDGVYHVYGTGLGDQTNETFENPEASFVKLMGHPTLATGAEANDGRLAAKIKVRNPATTFDGLTSNLGVTITASSTDRLPIIRNEELLLLRAEANIGLNNLAAAQADLNIIRAAAGLPAVTLTAANAVDQLLYERRYSLFMEGHRWVDVRRYNRLSQLPIDRATDKIITSMPIPETEVNEGGGGGR